MATPRQCSVSISIANAPLVDVTSDLISFEYEGNFAGVGETLTIELDDSSKRYRSDWFVEKGTQVQVQISCTDWLFPGNNSQRTTGLNWVDVVELNAKPASVTIKASSINPNLLPFQANHAGFEGQSLKSIWNTQATSLDSQVLDGVTGASGGSGDGALSLDNMRVDQDNVSDLASMARRPKQLAAISLL